MINSRYFKHNLALQLLDNKITTLAVTTNTIELKSAYVMDDTNQVVLVYVNTKAKDPNHALIKALYQFNPKMRQYERVGAYVGELPPPSDDNYYYTVQYGYKTSPEEYRKKYSASNKDSLAMPA